VSDPRIAKILGWTFEAVLDEHHPSVDPGDWIGTWSHPDHRDRHTFQRDAPPYTVDDMLAWLRKQFPNQVKVGLQDDEVGFPAHLPAGFWVEVPVPRTSDCNTTLHAACEYAVLDVAKMLQDEQS
jgi:hypothetical protein